MNEFLKRYEALGKILDPKIKPRQAIRINTLKTRIMPEMAIAFEKIPFLKHGYYYSSRFSLAGTTEHLLGLIYIQEAASQLAAEVLDPKPDEKILDMSAAPGSKTTHLAMLMHNSGAIVALDSNLSRLNALKNNVERLGVSNVLAYKKDARFADDFGIEFDKVLLDAPCSGNFTTDESWFDKRNLDELSHVIKMQRQLLETGIAVLKVGGIMLYSTCSLEPEENEENISWLLEKHPEVKLLPINIEVGEPGIDRPFGKKLNDQVKLCKRIWPGEMQGFFMAKIVKN